MFNISNQFVISLQLSFRMHKTQNLLYQLKKQSLKRSSPNYQPDHSQDDLREQLAKLRTQLRKKDTEIIRMQGQIDELNKKITLFQCNSKLQSQQSQEGKENQLNSFSQVPMILQNKELKQQNQGLHKENLGLNGKNNELEAELRQAKSDIKRLESKLKELEILEKLREQRFKDEVQKLTPIIVQDNKDFSFLKEGIMKLSSFLRQNLITIVFEIFLKCAKECQKQKKTNSFSIFKNYWLQLKSHRSLGFLSVVKVYEAVKKLTRLMQEEYCELKQDQYRDTMNDWIINTLIDIKHTQNARQPEQKLFRYLSLLYRSKFPIKGEHYEMDKDIKDYFQDVICCQVGNQLVDKK